MSLEKTNDPSVFSSSSHMYRHLVHTKTCEKVYLLGMYNSDTGGFLLSKTEQILTDPCVPKAVVSGDSSLSFL